MDVLHQVLDVIEREMEFAAIVNPWAALRGRGESSDALDDDVGLESVAWIGVGGRDDIGGPVFGGDS